MHFLHQLRIKLFCKQVGIDEFGNRYFTDKNNKRFVVYNGMPEASKVPFEWHGWLHYVTDKVPSETSRFSWQKIHLPNLTGTKNAYNPKNSPSVKSRQTYQSWQPKN